jgi:formylglycine-generating enzyme required for sulfatase activity
MFQKGRAFPQTGWAAVTGIALLAAAVAARADRSPQEAPFSSRYFPDRPRSGLFADPGPSVLPRPLANQPSFETVAGIRMVAFPGGSLVVGNGGPNHAQPTANGPRIVRMRPFFLGQTEITQGQFRAVMGYCNSSSHDPDRPVDTVAFHEAVYFCWLLGELDGRRYRLPSEAEWELACRMGGDGNKRSPEVLPRAGAVRVGDLPPDACGLYGMVGNVAEWCDDHYRSMILSDDRCVRGGSWLSPLREIGPAARDHRGPFAADDTLGFRIAADY